MRDISLLLWLRVRHARWTINRALHLAGASIDDEGWAERAYQLYVAGIVSVWFVLMAAALVDVIQKVFMGAGIALCALSVQVVLIAVVIVLVLKGVAGVRISPLKLSHPDIAYLAASTLSTRALVAVAVGVQAFAGAATGGAVGFLLGVALESASVLTLLPVAVALVGAALAAAAVALGWIAGVVRLASARWSRLNAVAAVFSLVALVVVWSGLVLSASPAALLAPATFAALGAASVLSLVAVAAALALLAARVDMTRVIEENSLHADLCQFGVLSPLDPNDIAEYQRRRKLAARPVRFSLPWGEGRCVLVQRAVLSHARQYNGIPNLVMQGAFVVPLGVGALVGAGGPMLFAFWLAVAVWFTQGTRVATQAFRDDMRNRLVRDRLPFGMFELLVFDTLPAFVLTTAIACIVVIAALPAGVSPLEAIILAVLLSAASLLSCGLDVVRLFPSGPRLCYEYGAIALVGGGFVLSLFASMSVLVGGMMLLSTAIAAIVHFGAECAR